MNLHDIKICMLRVEEKLKNKIKKKKTVMWYLFVKFI